MRRIGWILAALLAALPGAGRAIPVAASIAPVQSLVMDVMGTGAVPDLLIGGGQSPHTFTPRPSTVRAIVRARVVFRIGPAFEASLNEALASAHKTQVVDLIDAPGVVLYAARDLDEPSLPPTDGLKDHLTDDPHIWLDPNNARAMLRAIERTLSAADPTNARLYRSNEATAEQWLSSLDAAIGEEMHPIKGARFVVFHDGYQYFERHYGLNFAGAVTEMAGREPGAAHIRLVRAEIKAAHVACVFSEPEFEPKLVSVITEGLPVRVGVLDGLGVDLSPGPTLYFDLMQGLSHAMVGCLAPR